MSLLVKEKFEQIQLYLAEKGLVIPDILKPILGYLHISLNLGIIFFNKSMRTK